MQIFSIFDEKAGAYLQPFFLPNIAVAQRALIDCLTDNNHQFTQHTSDYTLYRIGLWDTETGKIKSEIKLVNTLLQLKQIKDENHAET